MEIRIERTGRAYSFCSVEFLVTFPNGDQTTIWSPAWSELDDDDPRLDEQGLEYAQKLWENKSYKKLELP